MATPSDCQSCAGSGVIDVGDCEDGNQDECPECGGAGQTDYNADVFDPMRDAFRVGD